MIRFEYIFVLAAVLQVIAAQGPPRFPHGGPPPGFENIPEKCRGPPKGVERPEECCQVEPIYTEEEMASCGFKKDGEDPGRRGPPDCSKPLCLLRQKGFLDENDDILFPKIIAYLEDWAGDGNMRPIVDIVKENCLQEGKVPGPPQICEHARVMHCTGFTLFSNCPKDNWLLNDSCTSLKEHMEECRGPF